jgi:hypothetical protein
LNRGNVSYYCVCNYAYVAVYMYRIVKIFEYIDKIVDVNLWFNDKISNLSDLLDVFSISLFALCFAYAYNIFLVFDGCISSVCVCLSLNFMFYIISIRRLHILR